MLCREHAVEKNPGPDQGTLQAPDRSSPAVAVLAIDKIGPRPYHFRSGPASGPATRPGSKKSKISVVHSLAVLKGHPGCLKCGKTLWRPGLCPGPHLGSLQCSPGP